MVDITSALQSKSQYLAAADITKPIALTIEQAGYIEFQEQDGTHVEKILVKFQGARKGLLCNQTNLLALGSMYGYETDNWAGKRVMLTVKSVPFRGKIVPSIRVVEAPSGAAPQKAVRDVPPVDNPGAFDDEVPF